MKHYYGLIIFIFILLYGKAAQTFPSSEEIIKNLGIGQNVKWMLDPERTRCSLGDKSDEDQICKDKSCTESLIFTSLKTVDVIVSCADTSYNASTTKDWELTLDSKQNNLINIYEKVYIIIFSKDGKFMSLAHIPGEREKKSFHKVYKRN